MQQLLYKTKSGGSPQDKPRVYFICHPDDFDRTFTKVCEDIFKTHDCAIYYTENMTELLPEDTRELDLERMNLFVVPVTSRLMTTPSRANDFDLKFAKERNMLILPIMFETDIDSVYSRPENFGSRQYLAPFEHDLTAISYEEKLKKFLESTLFDEETVKRIREAFDAYIFLSYRKMDRVYANNLMKLIHSEPRYRDIAIWYDEFLTPGEEFDKEIEKVLSLSKLFAMAVTPNLVKYTPEGKRNYIMAEEYPKAKNAILDPASGEKMPILPIQMMDMKEGDWKALSDEFNGIPDSVDGRTPHELSKAMYDNLKLIALQEKNDDPEHNYLIGLAYLNGIDVETNFERARALFEDAHKAGILDATKQLSKMSAAGFGTEYNPQKAYEYELLVLDMVRGQKNTDQNKRKLVKELVDIAQICLLGNNSKIEPSPSKLFSIESAIQYYQDAVELQNELLEGSPQNEDDVFSICDNLSALCRLLSSGGAETWTDIEHAEAIRYYQKWVYYSTLAYRQSDDFERMIQNREAYYTLLREIGLADDDYEDILERTVNIATMAAYHNGSTPFDHDRLIEIMYNQGVKYYFFMSQYENTYEWLHSCFLALEKYQLCLLDLEKHLSLISEMDRHTYVSLLDTFHEKYDFWLSKISRKSIEIIYNLLKLRKNEEVKKTIDCIMQDVGQYADHNDSFLRKHLLPSIRKIIAE